MGKFPSACLLDMIRMLVEKCETRIWRYEGRQEQLRTMARLALLFSMAAGDF